MHPIELGIAVQLREFQILMMESSILLLTKVAYHSSAVARALWIVGCIAIALPAQARESSEDNRNVLVNTQGNVFAVMLCDLKTPNKCLIVEANSGDPLLMALRESDDRYFVVNYSTGTPVGRIIRVGTTVWRMDRL